MSTTPDLDAKPSVKNGGAKKEAPTLEHLVFDVVRESITGHLNKRLAESYNSPLDPFLKAAVEKHAPAIQAVYDSAISESFSGIDIKAALKEAFTHKLARVLIARFEGEIEKRANELRSDATFRAKLTLAIEAVIKEAAK